MSSAEEESDPTLIQGRRKKRRMRACDMCRRRKVRCDGGKMPNSICTNCITFKYKCTYVQSAPKRVPDAGYIECLETQMAEMRTLLNKYRQLCPDVDLAEDFNRVSTSSSPFPERSSTTSSPRPPTSTPMLPPSGPSMAMSPISPNSVTDINDQEPELDPSDDEVSARKTLAQGFEDLEIFPNDEPFLGKSSSMMFLQAALDIKQGYVVGGPSAKRDNLSPTHLGTQGLSRKSTGKSPEKAMEAGQEQDGSKASGAALSMPFPFHSKRPEFWLEHEWVVEASKERPTLTFPPPDLLDVLITTYFDQYDVYTPLLHRPTFERSVREGLHLRDSGFGSVLLMACALAARSVDDPRVLLPSEKEEAIRWAEDAGKDLPEPTYHSAGWQWFTQVQKTRLAMSFVPPGLYDLQIAYLAAVYVWGTSSKEVFWQSVGHGLRLAQTLGAHRKKAYQSSPTVEQELRKRAFWALVFLDRMHSSVLGRPCGIQDEDFDVDLPLECDDEYWEHPDPEQRFKQPEGKPSRNIFFSCLLRLTQIHSFALRTIYSLNKSKALLGLVGPDWQQRIVAEIDSALNGWIDSIPEHLRWDPHMKNSIFLNQSALLYSSYYTIQITVHRPFIPSPRRPSPLSFPSLAICTNAARSCIHVLDEEWRKTGMTSHLHMPSLFSSGIVLLLNIWDGKRSGASTDPSKEMREVYKAMNLLKQVETRWYSSGRIWDILHELANMGDLPLPQQTTSAQKRPHSGVPESSAQSSRTQTVAPGDRHIAGSKRVQQYQQSSASSVEPSPGISAYSLPIYTQELGRLPIHPSTDPGTSVVESGSPSGWNPNFAAYGPPSTAADSAPRPQMTQPNGPIDPAFEALVSMLALTQYQQSAFQQQTPMTPVGLADTPQNFPTFVHNQALHTIMNHRPPTNMASGSGYQVPQEPMDPDASAMWSAAPSNLAWEDWGAYVNAFNSHTGPFPGHQ